MGLLFQEMFATTGQLDADQPGGNLTGVQGILHQRAGGPHLAGQPAASADLRINKASIYGVHRFAEGGEQRVFAGGWFYFKQLQNHDVFLITLQDGTGDVGLTVLVRNGQIHGGLTYGAMQPCLLDVQNRWVFLGVAASHRGDRVFDVKFYSKLVNQPMTCWAEVHELPTWLHRIGGIEIGARGNNPDILCRVGAPFAYRFEEADFSDVAYPADIVEPETGLTWHCNPATGNDSNDGTSPEKAWRTTAKLNEEGRYIGMFPAESADLGDTLLIDTGEAELDSGGLGLMLRTAGLNVRASPGQEWIRIKSYRSLSSHAWEPAGIPNVFTTTDTQAHIVVWEDDKWLHHPTGPTLTSVAEALSSTPGSFWTDGARLYLHPFGGTDPRNDGKRYERSYNFSNDPAEAGASMAAANLRVCDLHIGKTALAHAIDNDAIMNYCLRCVSTGQVVIEHCYLYYGAKHNLGIVAGAAGTEVLIDDVRAEQGSPYPNVGGQTVFVSFEGGPSNMGIIHRYRNCVSKANTGLIGSTTGTINQVFPTFYSHNVTGSNQFARFEFIDCDFGNGPVYGGAVGTVLIQGSTMGAVGFGSNVTIERSRIQGALQCDPDFSLSMRHSIQSLGGILHSNSFAGTVAIQACTLDGSSIYSIQGGVPQAAFFTRSGPIHFTFRNNVVRLPADFVGANLFSLLRSTDTLDINHNAYQLGANRLVYQYQDADGAANRSLDEWQDLGFDAASFDTTDLKIDAALRPLGDSPLVGAGDDLGPAPDLSGTWHQQRRTIGAWEPLMRDFAAWQRRYFSAAEMTDAEASFSSDGIPNLLKYALNWSPDDPASRPALQLTPHHENALLLEFNLRRHAPDLTVSVETSTDFSKWDSVPLDDAEWLEVDDGTLNVRKTLPCETPSDHRFYRLRADLASP